VRQRSGDSQFEASLGKKFERPSPSQPMVSCGVVITVMAAMQRSTKKIVVQSSPGISKKRKKKKECKKGW
jgi:hypothetical protein